MHVDDQTPVFWVIPPGGRSFTKLNRLWFRSDFAQLNANIATSRDKFPISLTHHHPDVSALDVTCDRAPGVEPVQVLVAIACVLVKLGSAASFGWIEHKRQRVGLVLAHVIHLRP